MTPETPLVRSSTRVVQELSEFCVTDATIESPAETDRVLKSISGYSGYSSHQPASLCCTPLTHMLRTPVWSRSSGVAPVAVPPMPTQLDIPAFFVCEQLSFETVNRPETWVMGLAEGTT